MAYNANIPLATDLLSQSQADLRSNFQEINTFLSVNHESLNSVAPHAQGKHKQIEMPVQAAGPAADATQWAMYVKNNGGGSPAIWLQPPAGTAVDFTTSVKASPGTCTLPCGIILKWGTSNADNTTPTVFATAFPTNCLNVSLTMVGVITRKYVQVTGMNAAQFTTKGLDSSGSNDVVPVYWIAIGY